MLFAAFVVGVVLTLHRTTPAPVPQPSPRPPAAPPLRVTAGAFAAAVRAAGGGLVRWGPAGAAPLLWQPLTGGRATLRGLLPATRYRATVGGRTVRFTTLPAPGSVHARVAAGVLEVDRSPFFPLIDWQECPGAWPSHLRDGIDLFAGNPCTNLAGLLGSLAGRALAAGTTEDVRGTTGPGLIGWFYPDEADARGETGATLAPGGAGLRFLTLTSHFFAPAAPLPAGRGMYPGLVAAADVVGFDLYPLQGICRPDLLPWVYDAQVALRALAPGKPTFQWIEEREMNCPQPQDAVTPATIRVESWLAIAGGARGLGFFPSDWSASTGIAIRGVTRRIRQLLPALVQPPLPVTLSGGPSDVRASARSYGGAVYVIVVNAATAPAAVTLTAPELGDRAFLTAGRADRVVAHDGALAVSLPARSVRIYVAPPAATGA